MNLMKEFGVARLDEMIGSVVKLTCIDGQRLKAEILDYTVAGDTEDERMHIWMASPLIGCFDISEAEIVKMIPSKWTEYDRQLYRD